MKFTHNCVPAWALTHWPTPLLRKVGDNSYGITNLKLCIFPQSACFYYIKMLGT